MPRLPGRPSGQNMVMALLDRIVSDWFAENRRDLPWRDSDPWGVYVSEIMLQQTPVSRVPRHGTNGANGGRPRAPRRRLRGRGDPRLGTSWVSPPGQASA